MTEPAAPAMPGVHSDDVRALEGALAEFMAAYRRYTIAVAADVHPDLMPGTLRVLGMLVRLGGMSPSHLAERLEVDKGMVSRAINELEEMGFIERSPDPVDRRARIIDVTALGRDRYEAARAPHRERFFAALSDWSPSDIARFTHLLHAVSTGSPPAPSVAE